jgi:hypothetical protein
VATLQLLVIKPWSNNYEYCSETRVPLRIASAWAVIGSKYLLVLSANGDLHRFVHTYWIITPSPSAFATLLLLLLLVLFSALLGLCEVLKTLCVCSDDALLGDALLSSQRNSVFLVTNIF